MSVDARPVPAVVLTPDRGDSLRELVVEQVMRATGDLGVVELAATGVDPVGTVGLLVHAEPALNPVAGSPLAVWAAGGQLDPAWRVACPVRDGSAWASLGVLEVVYGTQPGDALDRLLALDALVATEVAA